VKIQGPSYDLNPSPPLLTWSLFAVGYKQKWHYQHRYPFNKLSVKRQCLIRHLKPHCVVALLAWVYGVHFRLTVQGCHRTAGLEGAGQADGQQF